MIAYVGSYGVGCSCNRSGGRQQVVSACLCGCWKHDFKSGRVGSDRCLALLSGFSLTNGVEKHCGAQLGIL